MLKFENIAQVGDIIKAFDFKPMSDRPDHYIAGCVVEKGSVFHPEMNVEMFKRYHIEVTHSSREGDERVGTICYVPFQLGFMEYDERVSVL